MKRFLICLIAIGLVGCTTTAVPLKEQMQAEIEKANEIQAIDGDNRKDFYSYYTEPSIGRISSSPSSNVFVKGGIRFVMNLNVSKIINEEYYKDVSENRDSSSVEHFLFAIEGQYSDVDLNIYEYRCEVYQYEGVTMVLMETQFMDFYAIGNEREMLNVVGDMIHIAKTVQVNQTKIITAYSSKESVPYKKEALNLFEVAIPENGRVDEMIADKTSGVGENINENGAITGDIFETDDFGKQVSTPEPSADSGVIDENYATDDIN